MKATILLFLLAAMQPVVGSPDNLDESSKPSKPGVIIPDGVVRERAVLIENGAVSELGTPDKVFSSFATSQLPPSDRSWFTMLVYVDRNAPSRQLLSDLDNHPSLRILKNWFKFIPYQKGASIGIDARFIEAKLKDAEIPTILIFADPRHPKFGKTKDNPLGWRYVYQRSGYGGDAAMAAREIYSSLCDFYRSYGMNTMQSWDQCDPNDPNCPWNPQPQPNYPRPWNPLRPSPGPLPNNDDWDIRPLPRIDQPTNAPWDWLSGVDLGPVAEFVWTWVKLFAVLLVLYILWIRFGKPPGSSGTATLLVLSLMLLAGPAMAVEPQATDAGKPVPVAAAEDTKTAEAVGPDKPVGVYYPDGVIRPRVPKGWDWMVPIIRDEVRRNVSKTELEGMLLDSWNSTEVRVFGLFNQVTRDVREQILFVKIACVLQIGSNVIVILLVLARTGRRSGVYAYAYPPGSQGKQPINRQDGQAVVG